MVSFLHISFIGGDRPIEFKDLLHVDCLFVDYCFLLDHRCILVWVDGFLGKVDLTLTQLKMFHCWRWIINFQIRRRFLLIGQQLVTTINFLRNFWRNLIDRLLLFLLLFQKRVNRFLKIHFSFHWILLYRRDTIRRHKLVGLPFDINSFNRGLRLLRVERLIRWPECTFQRLLFR